MNRHIDEIIRLFYTISHLNQSGCSQAEESNSTKKNTQTKFDTNSILLKIII